MGESNAIQDNRYQVYIMYLWSMFFTLCIVGASFFTYYQPTIRLNFLALEYLNENKSEIFGQFTNKDARFYGVYLQSAANFVGKSNTFFTWMVSCHAIIVGIAVICERLFARLFANKFFYQDLTLEFKGISHQYDTEEKVLALFNELSSNNVKEISLIYDLNEYFGLKYKLEKIEVATVHKAKTVTLGNNPRLQLAKEMVLDRINHFKAHFVRFKQAYFQQRGFVTFNNPKIAFEMKEIYKKALGEDSKGPLNALLRRLRPQKDRESPARVKFRSIVFQKIMKPRMAQSGKQLSSLIGVLFGGKNNIFLNKVMLMRAEVGPNFEIKRGVSAEEINWSYIPEQKISINFFIGFFVLILFVIPFIMYLLSVVYYERTLDSLMGVQQGVLGFLYTNVFFVLMLVLDQVAIRTIDAMFSPKRFMKQHQMQGLKFITTNLYNLSSNLFFLFLGFMHASNSKMSNIVDPKEQFRVTKALLDSFYMTFAALIVSSLATQLITPIYQFYHGNKGVPVQRDISFGLSFMCQAIFYVGYFVAFDCNIIVLMFLSLLVLLVSEVALFRLGLIQPTRVCYSIIGNYFTAMLFGLLPISLSAFLMLSGNKLGIKTIDLGKEYLGQSSLMIGLMCLYLVTVFIFGALYKNERLLKRVQSMIWKVNDRVSVPSEILGSSYRASNPVYTFETKVKSD